MFRNILLCACGFAALSGGALAADYTPALYAPYPISGYVELRGGVFSGTESGSFVDGGPQTYIDNWRGSVFGGAGRAAIGLTPNFSVQADAWADVYSSSGSGSDTTPDTDSWTNTEIQSGIATHLTWRTDGGHLFGFFGSIGAVSDWGSFGTLGVEAVHNFGNWRMYGQVGATAGLFSEAAADGVRDLYARGLIAYYFTPNMVLAGNLGIDSYSENGASGTGYTWGARLEYKHDTMPVSGFLAYQGWHWSGSDNDPSTWKGSEHAVLIGARLLFNGDTLRQIDQTAGLSDMNALYGENYPH